MTDEEDSYYARGGYSSDNPAFDYEQHGYTNLFDEPSEPKEEPATPSPNFRWVRDDALAPTTPISSAYTAMITPASGTGVTGFPTPDGSYNATLSSGGFASPSSNRFGTPTSSNTTMATPKNSSTGSTGYLTPTRGRDTTPHGSDFGTLRSPSNLSFDLPAIMAQLQRYNEMQRRLEAQNVELTQLREENEQLNIKVYRFEHSAKVCYPSPPPHYFSCCSLTHHLVPGEPDRRP